MKMRLGVPCRYTHTKYLCRDDKQGVEVEGRHKEGEDVCARGAAGVIVALPDTVHELGIATDPVRSLYMRLENRVATSQCQK